MAHMDNKQERFLKTIDQNRGIIYKVANTYCRDEDGRKDLVQEIIIQLWKSFDRYNEKFKISTWMYRIALNVSISFYRRDMSRKRSEVPLAPGVGDASADVDSPGLESDLGLLQRFIAELKELDRALMLLYLEEKPHREIAEIMGLTETNVGTKIGRIREKLKIRFAQTKR